MRNTLLLLSVLWVMWTIQPGGTDTLEVSSSPDGPWLEQSGPYEVVDMGDGRLDHRVEVPNEDFKFFRVRRVLTIPPQVVE